MGFRRALATVVIVLGVAVLGFSAWVRSLLWFPADLEPIPASCASDAPVLPVGRPIKVLVWNVQYAASRKHRFFYDGGTAVHVPREDVEATIDAISAVIRREEPDLVLLQEVDRGSDRTHRIDQHAALLQAVPYPCHASTPYHRVGYLPHPGHEHLRRVDMHLSIFSRYRLGDLERVQLPLLDEPWWRRVMNLRRALMVAELPVEDGRTFVAMNTHLSAFSRGDGTLGRQMEVLDRFAALAETGKQPWLLAGDLNALPPGDDPSRLGADADQYAEAVTPAQRLFDRYNSAVPAPQYTATPDRWRTYLPFGTTEPDRTLDYAFVGRTVDVQRVEILQDTAISDHLPILLELVIE